MATYLPTANITVFTFVQKTSTSSALQSALIAAFPGVGSIQCFDDGVTAGNSLVVFNDQQVFSVPASNYVGYNGGSWAQYLPAKMAGGAASIFTAYP